MQQDGASMDRAVARSGRWLARLVILGIVVVLVTCGYLFFPNMSRWVSADRSIEADRLRIGTVTRGDLVREVSVQGKIVAADQPTLVSPAQGVVSFTVKAGDVVQKGTPLAGVESPELQNSLEQERSKLLSERAELDRTRIANRQIQLQDEQEIALLEVELRAGQRAMERARALYEEGLGSSMDYQKSLDELEVAQLELNHAREKTKLAQETMQFEVKTKELEFQRQQLAVTDLERKVAQLQVVSPVSGMISRIEIKDKDTVQPNQPLFRVVDLSRFEVEILVPENYADEIGLETEAVISYEGREFQGRVKSLSPEVENSQFRAIVTFSDTAPENLKQNQRVNTRLVMDRIPGTLKVARGPFLESMGGRQAYLVRDGVAVLRPITVGALSLTEVEVTSGLEPGDEIVLSDLSRFDGVEKLLLIQ